MLRRALMLSFSLSALLASATTISAEDKDGIDFFETKIRPVLSEKCYACHSVAAEAKKKLKGALYLDSKEGVLKGGDTGTALVPGDPDKSLMIKAIRYHDDDTAMPPKEKMPDPVIADFEHWVRMGAPDPRTGTAAPKAGQAIAEQTKTHWSFQPVAAVKPPAVKQTKWTQTEIDHFILAKLEAAKIPPAPTVDKRTLVRRATHDLTGLPPTAEEVAAFEADKSPEAFARVIDRLLASPAYGERWGRHWLDVARYADSKGYVFQEDRAYPYAYTYRDWVVQSFNDDLPYDRFLQMQIAADRLVDMKGDKNTDDKRHLAALGFMTVGRRFINNPHDIIDDRIDVLSRGTMGLTISCSRCHDHKFDPISTKEYYGFYGMFASSEEPSDPPIIGNASDPKQTEAYGQEKAKREKEREDFRAKTYAERLKELRSGEMLAKYLLAAQDALGQDDGKRNEIVSTRQLERSVFNRWRVWLEKIDAQHPVLGPWKLMVAFPDGEFAQKAKELLTSNDHGWVNPVAVAALKGKEPKNREELSKLYGALLAANDGEQKHEDGNQEAIRQLVRGDGTPTAVAYDQANEVLNGKDEDKLRELKKKVDELASQHAGAPPRAMVLVDRANPHNVKVFVRGQPGNNGDEAPRGFLSFIAGKDAKPFSDGSGRLELARAIANKDNPLTARVMANRVWAWHFGTGLVRTPSDFGLRTEAPVHRELLDWLAARFVADGWSVKKLHRLIMLSATYQQSSNGTPASVKLDPENALVSRFSRQRMSIEAMRDALLFASGKLDRTVGGKSVDIIKEPFTGRRTLYGSIDRQNLPGMFRSFDFASPDAHTPQRFFTTVPQQALYLMNSPFAVEQARALAKRSDGAGTPDARVQQLYRLAFARSASKDEVKLGTDFIKTQDGAPAETEATPVWLYGYGVFDPQARTLSGFTKLPKFKDNAWRGGDNMPDEKLGYVNLTANGGHPGNSHAHAAVRRFTAPHDGLFTISGTLKRPAKEGDGVRALVILDGQPPLGDWEVTTGEVATTVGRVHLKAGQTLDFVVDGKSGPGWDSFEWSPQVAGIEGTNGTWNAADGFSGPKSAKPTLSAWERYAHALLMTNEFVFVD
ncbi:MAG: DUF1553 domain-containing protein [Planctomycetes bacterium]|nr:DUF1553 domain-containing protein [Planctomycetota bacterium]